MTRDPKDVLLEANAAISRGDHEGFLSFCTEDTEWTFVGDRTLSGKAAVRAWMKNAYREPPRFRVDRLLADGDTVAAIGEITMEHEPGQTTTHAYCDVWQLRDGKLAALQAFVI